MAMNRIVVAIDLTASADLVIDAAITFGRALNASLELVYVYVSDTKALWACQGRREAGDRG